MSSLAGRWVGTAEVYSGEGRFLGNGVDTRNVQEMGNGLTRIDVSFIGPFKQVGHYFIQASENYRLYQGPANIGYAETLAEGLVDANAYWSALGLSQRFVLMTVGDLQLSLALMSRGEQLIYVIVGQNDRVEGETPTPSLVSGTSYDFADDPAAGRGEILLHRAGTWSGELTRLDEQLKPVGKSAYCEKLSAALEVNIMGALGEQHGSRFKLKTNGWQAWTTDIESGWVGSYSLSGGRALSGHFHVRESHLRVWRREVVAYDGTQKSVVNVWYRGGERVGVEYGLLRFEAGS
jgi:hypothetical protein